MKNIPILLACSGELGCIVLQYCYKKETIIAVLTDKKSLAIIDFCEKHKLAYFAGNARNNACFNFVQNYRNSILLSVNYLFLFDIQILDLFEYKFNIHGSLLPKYRGRTPHIWAIINNEKQAGITIHNIVLECDAGDILFQKKVPIKYSDTGGSVLKKYFYWYPKVIGQFLQLFREGELSSPQKQNERLMTYFGKRTPEDGKINWNWQRERIYNWVRALTPPYPGAFCYLKDNKVIIRKIVFSHAGFSHYTLNGTVVSVQNNAFTVKTPNGCIDVTDYTVEDNIPLTQGIILDQTYV
ncbi:hypothetical protein AGMMS49942_08180 [Spirochaetia bacterium]|nr:hypothetical protein AGMMS49942_08180 [Spirochaetia bacterium]